MSCRKAVTASGLAVRSFAQPVWKLERLYGRQHTARIHTIPPSKSWHTSSRWQQSIRCASSQAPKEPSSRTALYELHSKYGAKFVPFGGYAMPVQYSDQSIIDSHHWTREKHHFSGPGAEAFLEIITPSALSLLPVFQSTLSVLLRPETGGIVDDTVITRLPETFYVVTNAGCREKDTAYFAEQLKTWNSAVRERPVEWKILDNQGLIALQGPLSSKILARALSDRSPKDLEKLYFGQCTLADIKSSDAEVLVSRGGYTGEDGFEISVPSWATESFAKFLLDSAQNELRLAGIGARDTLRLEAGMCLYGHDLDESITPVEAALSWVIGKDRRANGGFHGDSVILQQLKKKSEGGGVSRRRVGFIVEGSPAREGAEVVDETGEKIGNITSGCPSPTLNSNIAMGYIKDGMHKPGTEVEVVVRGKKRKAVVTKMPFIPSKYYKQAANIKA